LRFFTLYRFQGSVLSSELVHIITAPIGCQHLFSTFLKLFLILFKPRTLSVLFLQISYQYPNVLLLSLTIIHLFVFHTFVYNEEKQVSAEIKLLFSAFRAILTFDTSFVLRKWMF